MPIKSDDNDATESPKYRMRKTEENEPVKAESTASLRPDSALKKGLRSLETIVFKVLSGLMLVAGVVLLWQALKLGAFLFNAGSTKNPVIGFVSIIGLFFALSIGGIGIAMIKGSVLAWTGSLMIRARIKGSKGSLVGLAILVTFFIFVIKPAGENLRSNVAGTLDLVETFAAASRNEQGFYPNGQIRGSQSTTDGEKNGLPVKLSVNSRYYENGQMSDELHYTDGVPDGLKRAWYADGQLQLKLLLVDGERQGLQTEWHRNGQKSSETNYVNDSPVGTKTSWYENGQIKSEIQFEQGREIGNGKYWTESGELMTL